MLTRRSLVALMLAMPLSVLAFTSAAEAGGARAGNSYKFQKRHAARMEEKKKQKKKAKVEEKSGQTGS